MVVSQNQRMKRSKKRIFIAIVVAVIPAIILIIIINNVKACLLSRDAKILELMKKIDQLEYKIREMEQFQAVNNAGEKLPNTPINKTDNKVTIVVAKNALKIGTKLSNDNLATIKILPENKPDNSFADIQTLIGRIACKTVAPKETILSTKLFDSNTSSLQIPDGQRAVTIGANKLLGLSSLVEPGSRLDLFAIMPKSEKVINLKDAKSHNKASKLLINNLKVLSSTYKNNESKSKGNIPDSITLLVPNEKVSRLILALNGVGVDLQVVLRNNFDSSEISKNEIDTNELITGTKSTQKLKMPIQVNLPKKIKSKRDKNDLNAILNSQEALPPPNSPNASTHTHSVEVINANNRKEVSFETKK